MSKRLTISIDATDRAAAVVNPQRPESFERIGDFVINDSGKLELVFIMRSGAITEWSGDLSYTVRAAIGRRNAVPDSGAYPLSDGTDTVNIASPDETAQTIQAALNSMNGGAGAFSAGNVTVSKISRGLYKVQYDNPGSHPLLTSDPDLLVPDSTVDIIEKIAGDASTEQVFLIALKQNPFAVCETWTAILDGDGNAIGYEGHLDLATIPMIEAMAGSEEQSFYFEVEVIDPNGNPTTSLQAPVSVYGEVIFSGSSSPASISSLVSQYVQNRFSITRLTGGTLSDLDGLITTTMATGTLVAVKAASGISFYQLEDGTDPEAVPVTIRPDDYAVSTNEKVWKLKNNGKSVNYTSDPTTQSDRANTDSNGHFLEGDIWVNTSTDSTFVCVDATATAAIWQEVNSGRYYVSGNTPTADDDGANTSGNGIFTYGHLWINPAQEKAWVCVFTGTGMAVWLEINDASDFATAAQGTLADSATQPGDNASTLGSGAATDGQVLTADGAGNAAWEDAATGGMTELVQDTTPQLGGDLDLNGNAITDQLQGLDRASLLARTKGFTIRHDLNDMHFVVQSANADWSMIESTTGTFVLKSWGDLDLQADSLNNKVRLKDTVMDEAGNETQISPHAAGAPSWFYDIGEKLDHVYYSANYYAGRIEWTNETRKADLMQRQLLGEDLSTLTTQEKTFHLIETFDEYNTRMGYDKGDAGCLCVRDWQTDQDTKQAAYDAHRQSVIDENESLPDEQKQSVPEAKDIRKPAPQFLK